MTEQPARDAGVSFQRGEIRRTVLAAQRQSRDEVMQDEVVQDDDARTTTQRIHDPAMRLRIVAHVVERDVGCNGTRPAAADDLDVHEPLERGQQK